MLRSLHQLFFAAPAHAPPAHTGSKAQAPIHSEPLSNDPSPHNDSTGMYADTHRGLSPSPVYDVPELPTLRRMKPLPKRRRTSEPDTHTHLDSGGGASGRTSPNGSQGPDDQAEDGTGRATLTAQMALQAYYMPVLGGVRDLFKTAPPDGDTEQTGSRLDLSSALAGLGGGFGFGLSTGYGYADSGGMDGRDGLDDDESGEGDYVDHLQQPGNTKKRKVPANMSGSAHDGGDSASGGEDEPAERGIPTGRERDAEGGVGNGGGGGGGGGGGAGMVALGGIGVQGAQGRGGRRGRLTRATLAGLQHKELLRSRKRQLAVVLGALAHGDTLALDQALSASYPFVQTGIDYRSGAPVRVRLSQRREARLARAFKVHKESLLSGDADSTAAQGDENTTPAPAAPSSEFTFVYNCATSDRLIATKEEVAILHGRFEEELARQAARAAEAAKQAAAAALSAPAAKRMDRTKVGGADAQGALDAPAAGAKKGGKKKKRSALANASNPHHLRNYVPSRLPHTGPPSAQQAAQNAQNMLNPLPLRFLAAEIPPRRTRKKASAAEGAPPPPPPVSTALANPADEWICPFCEHELFYGDEQSYHRAVRNRKKILRRRRRARERAAAAASGVAPPATAAALHPADRGEHEVAPAPAALDALPSKEPASSPGKAAKWKEGDRGARGVAAHT